MAGRSRGRGRWIAAAAAGLWLAAPASGQQHYFQFEPPIYFGAPQGVPLEGQDDWHLPGPGGGGEWLVYAADGAAIGVPISTAGGRQFIGATTLGDVAASIQHDASFGLDLFFMLDIAVAYSGPLPAATEFARVSLEPGEVRSTFAIVLRWDDPAIAEAWTLEMLHYTASGERQQSAPSPYFESLAPYHWYQLNVRAAFDSNRILDVSVRDKVTGRQVAAFAPTDWYMAGGVAPLGKPFAVQIAAGAPGDLGGVVVGADNLFASEYSACYSDCDKSRVKDLFDFLCFQNLFAAGDPYADCDGSTSLDYFDFLCFLNEYAMGCDP